MQAKRYASTISLLADKAGVFWFCECSILLADNAKIAVFCFYERMMLRGYADNSGG